FRSVAFAHGTEDYHGRVRPERVEEAERGEIHASLSVDARHPSDGPRRDAGSEQSVDVDRLGRSDFDFHVGSSGNKKTHKIKTNRRRCCVGQWHCSTSRLILLRFVPLQKRHRHAVRVANLEESRTPGGGLHGWRFDPQPIPGRLDVLDLDHEMEPIPRPERAQRLPLSCVVEYFQAEAAQVKPPTATAGAVPSLGGRKAKALAVKPHHLVKPISCQRDEAHAGTPATVAECSSLAAHAGSTSSTSSRRLLTQGSRSSAAS